MNKMNGIFESQLVKAINVALKESEGKAYIIMVSGTGSPHELGTLMEKNIKGLGINFIREIETK